MPHSPVLCNNFETAFTSPNPFIRSLRRRPWPPVELLAAVSARVMYKWWYTDPQYSAIEQEALLLTVKYGVILLVRLRDHESSLVPVRVKLVGCLRWIEPFEAVFLERIHENGLGHSQSVVQRLELLVLVREHLRWHSRKCSVKVVDTVDKVLCELLESEISCGLNLPLGLRLEVPIVCYLSLPLVLRHVLATRLLCAEYAGGLTVMSNTSFFFASSSFATGSSLGAASSLF